MARIAMCQDVMVEYMGFMTISAVLKKASHTVEVFFDDQLHEDRFIGELAEFRPDTVFFSILSPSLPWALRIGKRVKAELGALTVYGNVHAITNPEFIQEEGVDIVCVGEGEKPTLELCNALDAGKDFSRIAGFWVKTAAGIVRNEMLDGVVDVEALPFHDRQMYNKYSFFRHSSYVRVMAGRGCPYRCSFCTNPVLMDHFGGKRYLRKSSPARAIAELEHTIANQPHKVKSVFFIDEVLWFKSDWLHEFLDLYKKRIGLPFMANLRLGGMKEEDVRRLAEAGATNASVATETGDEDQRRGLMNKHVSNEHFFKVAGWMHKYGISFSSSVFFGLPGDTVEDHLKRLDFFRKVNPTYIWTTFFQPYPGLKLTEHMDIRKHLPEGKAFSETLHHDMYLNLPDKERLVNLKMIYFYCVKFPALTPALVWLTKYRIPGLFTILFGLHFTYYAMRFERISAFQFLIHIKNFAINPYLRKHQPLPSTGRPFAPPIERVVDRPEAAGPRTVASGLRPEPL